MRHSLVFAIPFLVATPALSQPYSQSMAQCAGLYEGVLGAVAKPENKRQIDHASRAFMAAALTEARAEGQADAEGWVTGHRDAMRDDWAARGPGAVLSEEFRDWTAYCRSFANDRGIDIILD